MERVTPNVGQSGSMAVEQGATAAHPAASDAPGLAYVRVFARAGRDPYEEIAWDLRDAVIANERGEAVFEQRGVEVPRFWSQQATNIVVSKYFRGAVGTPDREWSVKQLISRVVDAISGWAREQRYFAGDADLEAFSDDLRHLLVHQQGAFNSPVWFNCGIEPHPQMSACFIQSVEDTLEDIMTLAKSEAMLFKFGSGTGTDLSTLRSSREKLAGGGTPSGPVSFMQVYDAFAGVIKSGGKTRRAAKMVILKVEHPDMMEFIECKVEEEKKARALIDAGYDGSFNGEAYSSIFFQNANNSVRVTDDFMHAVIDDGPWQTRAVTDAARVMDTYKARDVHAADRRGDLRLRRSRRAVRHDDQRLAHLPELGPHQRVESVLRVHVPRRLGLQPGQLNLMKFRRATARSTSRASGTRSRVLHHRPGNPGRPRQLPDAGDRRNSHRLPAAGPGLREPRRLLMSRGLPYDSDAGRACAAAITALMTRRAYVAVGAESPRDAVGPFDGYEKNREPMLRVMQMHRDAVERDQPRRTCRPTCCDAAREVWDEAVEPAGARLPQRAGHRAGAHRHDQLHDGLRHDRHRARHRAGEVQAARRRRHAEDRQPDGALGPREAWATTSPRSRRSSTTSTSTTRSKAPRPEGRAPAGVRLCVPAGEGQARDPLHGPHPDDGGRAAVPLRGDLQDRQHAEGRHGRGHRRRTSRLEARPEGPGHLPRRLQAEAAAEHLEGRQGKRRPAAAAAPVAAHPSGGSCPTRASPSPTSSTSRATRATSPSASTRTAGRASSSSRWPRKAPRSAG